MRVYVLLLSLLLWHALLAQDHAVQDSLNVPNSENGWYLSPHGTIRIQVIFAEVAYDTNPTNDPQPGG